MADVTYYDTAKFEGFDAVFDRLSYANNFGPPYSLKTYDRISSSDGYTYKVGTFGYLYLYTNGVYLYQTNPYTMNGLSAGEIGYDSYTILNSYGTETTFVAQIYGANDSPVVGGPVSAASFEDGNVVRINALQDSFDPDHDGILSIVNIQSSLPAGVTYDESSKTFAIDPANAAYQALARGETQAVTVTYSVSDGIAAPVAQTAVFVITGVNDAPVV
ncbi:VCBS domain-containing protein, partial [Methylobacterium cerastii]|uniref:VCBS domain-containing protein n=1 Tax=Methylobacterium cerastii TaxID=932741 RepID=UPI001EE39579